MNSRTALDNEMQTVLTALAVCSHAPATSYEPRGRSGATDSADLSGGDHGSSVWAELYGPPFHAAGIHISGQALTIARSLGLPHVPANDRDRRRVLQAARDELDQHRGGSARAETRPLGETVTERDRRFIDDGEGIPAEEAAHRFGLRDAREARRIRIREQRYPEDGTSLAADLSEDQKRARAREMRGRSVPLRDIAKALDVNHMKVARWTRDMPTGPARAAA